MHMRICFDSKAGSPNDPCIGIPVYEVNCILKQARGNWPDFMDTIEEELPWKSPGPFTRILPQDPTNLAYFYRPDPWHTINLGMGRSWVANCLVLLIDLFPASSIPNQFKLMSQAYGNFCSNSVSRIGFTACLDLYLNLYVYLV